MFPFTPTHDVIAGAPGSLALWPVNVTASLSPASFAARTVYVYSVPLTRPVTLHIAASTVTEPFGTPVPDTTYRKGRPPSSTGLFQYRIALWLSGVISSNVQFTPLTGPGTPPGDRITVSDFALSPPALFTAVTWNRYCCPSFRFLITIVVSPVCATCTPS